MSKENFPTISKRPVAKLGSVVVSVALVAGMALPTYAMAAEEGAGSAGSGSSIGQPPDKPDGDNGEEPPGGFGGGSGEGGAPGEAPGGMGGGMGGPNTQTFDYSGTYTGTKTADGTADTSSNETLEATETLTNVALAQNAGTLDLVNDTLVKSGDANDGDSCNFYGVNSIALAVGEGSQLNISGTALKASSEGSNGVFATDNATAYVYKSSIDTTADNSRGLDATYGGTIVADSVSVSTQGNHCAGIATDRGGGNVSAENSSFTTNGSGSPILYSTGCIEVDSIEGVANGSQIAGMEGLNTIRISDSTLTSTITDKTASDPLANGVIIYQSTSGDAETSDGDHALFQADNSKLSSAIQSGAMFYVTNTTADIVLSETTLDFDSSKANLLTIAGNDANSWGSAGSNGGTVTFTAIDQQLEGDIAVDTISSLDFYLTDGSQYSGAINNIENESGYSTNGAINVTVDKDSTWVVTGDSTVANFSVAEGGKVVDEQGKTVTVVANGETVVSGESSVTVNVAGTYASTADTSGAIELTETTIDRSAFETYYGIEKTSAVDNASSDDNEADAQNTNEAEVTSEDGGFFGWLQGVWKSFLGLFGL